MKKEQFNHKPTVRLNEQNKEIIRKMEILLSAIDKVQPTLKTLMLRSFIQGLFVAIGTTIGLSIVITFLTFTLSELKVLPIFGTIIQSTHLEQIIPEKK